MKSFEVLPDGTVIHGCDGDMTIRWSRFRMDDGRDVIWLFWNALQAARQQVLARAAELEAAIKKAQN